ncbi:MAG: tetratricopeptide repeat protein, partial [bacterium]|nr:tetratricopeptide repeat protein [bacterium]
MDDINPIIKWFEENYKWFFSGLGVGLPLFLLGLFINKRKAKNGAQFNTGGGDNFQFNIYSPSDDEVSNRLVKELYEKLAKQKIDIEKRDKIIQKSIAKYNELKSGDNLDAQAKEKLLAGDLDGAKKSLLKPFKGKLESVTSASYAYQLGSLEELQIEYAKAREYYEKAIQLEPQNGKYLNALGSILDDMGDYDKAIEFHNKALKIS